MPSDVHITDHYTKELIEAERLRNRLKTAAGMARLLIHEAISARQRARELDLARAGAFSDAAIVAGMLADAASTPSPDPGSLPTQPAQADGDRDAESAALPWPAPVPEAATTAAAEAAGQDHATVSTHPAYGTDAPVYAGTRTGTEHM